MSPTLRRKVLIFKQSAGTGFDAPRAFVLASTKPVNDEDFAMPCIGRVMRVPAEQQRAVPVAYTAPSDLDTAYIFLANEQSQAGFADAVASTKAVMSQVEGQIEELVARRIAHGGVCLSNHVTDQTPLGYDIGLPTVAADGSVRQPFLPTAPLSGVSGYLNPKQLGEIGVRSELFGSIGNAGEIDALDFMEAASGNRPANKRRMTTAAG